MPSEAHQGMGVGASSGGASYGKAWRTRLLSRGCYAELGLCLPTRLPPPSFPEERDTFDEYKVLININFLYKKENLPLSTAFPAGSQWLFAQTQRVFYFGVAFSGVPH